MPELNDAQFPKPGSVKLKRNRQDPLPAVADYVSEDGKWVVGKERRDRWHVEPATGGEAIMFPTLRDANDYVNTPLDWEPEHKRAWLEGTDEGA